MSAQEAKFDNVDEMIHQAEATFRKGLGSLSQYVDQARDILQNQPNSILAVAGISGFLAGALLRHGSRTRQGSAPRLIKGQALDSSGLLHKVSTSSNLPVDPMFLVLGGIAAGLIAGPVVIEQLLGGIDKLNQGAQDSSGFGGARLRATGSMNERPFEKI